MLKGQRKFFNVLFALILALGFSLVAATPALADAHTTGGSGNWNSTTVNAPWSTGVVPVAGDTVTIASGHNVTVNASTAALLSITIASGATLTMGTGARNLVATTTTVDGNIVYLAGATGTFPATGITFNNGSKYDLQTTTTVGVIPTATWSTGSTCLISGYTSFATNLTGFQGQTFYNFTWNCPSQTGAINLSSAATYTTTINGNFTVVSTGTTGVLHFRKTGVAAVPTININGDLIIQAGTVDLQNAGGGTGAVVTINLAGNFNMTGGTVQTTTALAGASAVLNFTGAGKTFTQSGGTFNSGSSRINFNVNSPASLTLANNIPTLATYGVTVNSGGTLNCSTLLVTGAGFFTLNSGGTLGIGSTAGITSSGATGNIQVTGTRTYNAGANYVYNGTANQVIGTGFPTNLTGKLTINNTGNTVTLDNAKTIANGGSIDLVAGIFAAGTNLTMASTSTINRSEGSMTGTPQGTGVYNVNYTGNSKTTGTELAGSGLNNITVTLTSGQTLTLDQNRAPDGDVTLNTGSTFDLSTFTLNRSAAGGTLTVAGTLLLGGTSGGQTGSNFPTNFNTLTMTGGTVNYNNAAGGQTVYSTPTYATLTLGNTSGTQTAGGNLTATTLNNNTNAADILNMGANTLTVTTPNNTGTIRTQNTSGTPISSGLTWGGTMQYDAAGAQTVTTATYNNLTLSNTSGTSTADGAVTVNAALTTTSGGTLNMSTNQLLGTLSTITNNGTISTQNTGSTPVPSGKTWGGTVEYAAASAQTVVTGTYNNLTLSGSGTKTLTGLTTVNGNFSMSGSAAATTASALAVGGNLDLAGTASLTGGAALTVTGNFTLGATATFVGGAFIHNIAGNWINNGGTFTNTGSTINLNGSGQTISGSTTFHNLTKMIALADTLTFEASSTQTIEGILTLQGSPGQNLSLRSSVTDSQWYIDPQDGRSVIRLDVQDSNNINATAISVAPSVDSGGNTNWIFFGHFSGTVFTDEGSTNIGAGKTVAISVNGGAATTAETDINGVYSLDVSAFSGDDVIVYLKGETEKGAAVSRTSGAISNFDIYQNHLIVRHGPDTITNADLATADDNGDTDITSLYSISGSDLTVAAGIKLFIWSGRTFQPGGNVSVESLEIQGTFSVEANTVYVSGNWHNSGTFTAGTSTVTFNGTGQQTLSGTMTDSSAFYDLTLTNASGIDDPGHGVSFTPGIIFASDATATDNYTIITPSVRVQYNSGSTYTFNNINWNGQASGTSIFFRNSDLGSGTWLLKVSGTQTAVSCVNVARSDASGGDQIKADDGTDTDSDNNTNWFFGNNPAFFLLFD